jgi:hypothetical protein
VLIAVQIRGIVGEGLEQLLVVLGPLVHDRFVDENATRLGYQMQDAPGEC